MWDGRRVRMCACFLQGWARSFVSRVWQLYEQSKKTLRAAEEEKEKAEKEAKADGSRLQDEQVQMMLEMQLHKDAELMVDYLIRDKGLLDENEGQEFYIKTMGKIPTLGEMGIGECSKHCGRCKDCKRYDTFLFPSCSWEAGFWAQKDMFCLDPDADSAADVEYEVLFERAQRDLSRVPPFVAECVFKKIMAEPGMEPDYVIRMDDEIIERSKMIPSNGAFKEIRIKDRYRADFQKYLTKKHPQHAEKILQSLLTSYKEHKNSGTDCSGYSLERIFWNRREARKMTPAEKLGVVLKSLETPRCK